MAMVRTTRTPTRIAFTAMTRRRRSTRSAAGVSWRFPPLIGGERITFGISVYWAKSRGRGDDESVWFGRRRGVDVLHRVGPGNGLALPDTSAT